MDIKQVLSEENFVVVLDTNVLLNVYRYSPEFSEFALNCLKEIKDYVMLPATVYLEYSKHYKAEFAKMQKRVKNAGNETSEQIKRARMKVLDACDNLERLHFTDVDELHNILERKFDELNCAVEDFFVERSGLELISHFWNDKDHLRMLVEEWILNNKIMLSPSQEDIYKWCEEGEKRYKKEIPPGFKDSKNKDGVRKYSDLIIWKEILRFADKENKNIIFVTDDVKIDWWETSEEDIHLHSKLIEEFEKTENQIEAFVSKDFYNEISECYGVEKTDAVELALCMTDEEYCSNIAEKVFDEVLNHFNYSNTDYIDTSSAHIGSEGIDELEITEYEYQSAERIDRDDDIVTYNFKYKVTAEAVSYDYWGRDDDTKEVIRSLGTEHEFKGIVVLEVTREADIYLDFEGDKGFETVEIIHGDLKETYYNERIDAPIPEPGELGYCPECGCPLDVENDMGGFCIKCAPNH